MMRAPLALLLLLLAGQALAHDLQYKIDHGAAVFVKLFYADGHEFAFQSYEVYRDGEEVPFQVGSTDLQGRLVFLPDQPGKWRIKVISEDGHGVDISLTTGDEGAIEEADRPLLERHLRILVGVSLIFGVFGLVSLFAGRRRTT
jgi:nickel transport protein